jgi:hypothetical protein
MKQTVQSDAAQAQKAAEPARSGPAQQRAPAPGGRLGQMAAIMNGSPRVQQLAQLRDGSQQGPSVQNLKSLAAEVNQGAPAQLRGVANPSSRASGAPSGVKVFQLHKGSNEVDPTEDDMLIYKVVEIKTDKVVYVGQTELNVGIKARFSQHLKSGYHNHWSEETHKIEKLEGGSWTRFETDCAEQYWIDHFGGGDKLENGKNQVSNKRFQEILEYQEEHGVTLFRGEEINFPKGWHPAK